MLRRQKKHLSLTFYFLILKLISKISMPPDPAVPFIVSTKIETNTQAFPVITCYPIIPRSELKVPGVQITSADKVERIRESFKYRSIRQCIDHPDYALFIF